MRYFKQLTLKQYKTTLSEHFTHPRSNIRYKLVGTLKKYFIVPHMRAHVHNNRYAGEPGDLFGFYYYFTGLATVHPANWVLCYDRHISDTPYTGFIIICQRKWQIQVWKMRDLEQMWGRLQIKLLTPLAWSCD